MTERHVVEDAATGVEAGSPSVESEPDPTGALKRTFGTYPTGVTIVTTYGPDGPRGFTANSFTSVSIDPPLLLVCHSNHASSHGVFSSASGFVVNVLAAEQRELATRFASRIGDRFANLDFVDGHGGPIIPGAAAWLDCSMHDSHQAGDHSILIGRVITHRATTSDVLAYWRGSFVDGLETTGRS